MEVNRDGHAGRPSRVFTTTSRHVFFREGEQRALAAYRFASIDGVDRATATIEHRLERAESQQERAVLAEKIERFGRARRFAAEHGVLPAKDPEYVRTHPYSQRTSTSWGSRSSSHQHSSYQEHTIEHSRSDRAR